MNSNGRCAFIVSATRIEQFRMERKHQLVGGSRIIEFESSQLQYIGFLPSKEVCLVGGFPRPKTHRRHGKNINKWLVGGLWWTNIVHSGWNHQPVNHSAIWLTMKLSIRTLAMTLQDWWSFPEFPRAPASWTLRILFLRATWGNPPAIREADMARHGYVESTKRLLGGNTGPRCMGKCLIHHQVEKRVRMAWNCAIFNNFTCFIRKADRVS